MSNNIFKRIAEVQKAVCGVAKDTNVKVGNGSYKAVSHDAVLSAIRDAVISAGIVISTSQIGKGTVVAGETNSGNYKHRFEALYSVDFINIDDPADRHSVCIEAHAEDNGDKAPGKAISYATKTAELKLFLLATGENDELPEEEGRYDATQRDEKPWYNDFGKERAAMVADIERGAATAEEILARVKTVCRVSKKNQAEILALQPRS